MPGRGDTPSAVMLAKIDRAWTKIIPINARSLKRRGYQEFLVRGIRYAADHGAVAVTSSMGPTLQTPELLAAIAYAEQRARSSWTCIPKC